MQYEFLQYGSIAKIIDENGRDHGIDLRSVAYFIAQEKYTVKVEGIERYFIEYSPKTVHCFIAPAGAVSFPEHQDPVDVEIICLEGVKTLNVAGKDIELHKNESVLIPANTKHRATNKYASVMLSIGYE